MTQPAAGQTTRRPPGNPECRLRGDAVRAVVMTLAKPGRPVTLADVLAATRIRHTTLLGHLAMLQERGRIRGYSTAKGMVRVW